MNQFLVLIDPRAGSLQPILKQKSKWNTPGVTVIQNHPGRLGVEGVMLIEAPSKLEAKHFAKHLGESLSVITQLLPLTMPLATE